MSLLKNTKLVISLVLMILNNPDIMEELPKMRFEDVTL